MKYISLDRLRPSAGWKQRAEQALSEIQDLAIDERKRAIDARSAIWAELKDALSELSYGKCWYCETRQERSDNAVDHYRPKNRVAECEDHEGYWWLVFDCRNYRFSCTYCNSRRVDQVRRTDGGKQDHFPLLNEHERAYCPLDDMRIELPCLLDPTRATDPGLLWFQEDGQAVPRYDSEENHVFHLRSLVSIDLYHLNYTDTVERRRHLHNRIRQAVEHGDKCFIRSADDEQIDDLVSDALEKVMRDLWEMINETAEFSAAARDFLSGFRDREWVEGALATL